MWGKNVRGCLGIGKRDDQYFPWRVSTHTGSILYYVKDKHLILLLVGCLDVGVLELPVEV